MPEDIPFAKSLSIRGCGYNEYWLQDQIYNNPACLGLGDLESMSKERIQASGGRLDILLKNPEDDSMYEVEVMLGDTDESHIIRTIEYWDNEKRRWPQRQHYAVLIAESITRRFFNVIQLLSHSIPIIAIQANIVESNGHKSLFFSKILDTYEEIDDGSSISSEVHDEAYWSKKAPWTVSTAATLMHIIKEVFEDVSLNHTKNYVSVLVNGNAYFGLHNRSNPKSLLWFRISPLLIEEATTLLDEHNMSFVHKGKYLRITIDKKVIENHTEMLKQLAEIVHKSWRR